METSARQDVLSTEAGGDTISFARRLIGVTDLCVNHQISPLSAMSFQGCLEKATDRSPEGCLVIVKRR